MLFIGYYTVDCTISNYIWTSAQMTTILDEPIRESNTVKSSGHESKYSSVLYSQLYNYLLLYIQLFKENATFKLHFVLIVLLCMWTTTRYIHSILYALATKENVVI